MPAFAPRPRGATLLLIAVSARALAQAARRAGYAAIAIDAFGDEDARAACRDLWVVENAMGGFAGVDLEPVIARACGAYAPAGIVFGSGFDDCPQALAPLARHAPLLGSPGGLAAAKDPQNFAQSCATTGVRHPPIRMTAPDDPSPWLMKRRGGSGGLHIVPAAGRSPGEGDYWQRRIAGRAVSLLFVRNSAALTPVAWSEQWCAPAPHAPFRYGGAAGPVQLAAPDGLLERLAALTADLGVRGLASADFIDDGESFWLLEINPRPGATLDVFDDDDDPLLARHIAALTDGPAAPAKPRAPTAAAIVYAEEDATAPGEWPDGTADRPRAGVVIPAGAPVCTVTARAGSVGEAQRLVQQRAGSIRSQLREGNR